MNGLLLLLSIAHLTLASSPVEMCGSDVDCNLNGVLGVCVGTGCCSTTATASVTCSGTPYLEAASSSSRTCVVRDTPTRCGASGIMTGLCFGSACSGCDPVAHVGSILCSSGTGPGAIVDLGQCRWVYGDSLSHLNCVSRKEVGSGICSSVTDKFCGGSAYGLQCCLLSPEISMTQSESKSFVSTSSGTKSLSRNQSTFSVTKSLSESSSQSQTSATTSLSLTVTPPDTRSQTFTWSFPSVSVSKYSPSVSDTATEHVLTATDTITPPSSTDARTISVSSSLVPRPQLGGWTGTSADGIRAGNRTVSFDLVDAVWDELALPYLNSFFAGDQTFNPFGFSSRRDRLLEQLTTDASGRTLFMHLRQDECYEPREHDEVVSATFLPTDGAFVPSSTTLTITTTFEHDSVTWRSAIGLLLGLCVTFLIATLFFLQETALALHLLNALQNTILMGLNSAMRWRASGYVVWLRWISSPTYYASGFTSIRGFGVILVHTLVKLVVFALLFFLSRRVVKLRRHFPSLPLTTFFVLLPGSVNGAWEEMWGYGGTNPTHASRVFAAILLLLWTVATFALSIYFVKAPLGMTFEKYPVGLTRKVFQGVWRPSFLLAKYSSVWGMYQRDSQMSFVWNIAKVWLTASLTGFHFGNLSYSMTVFVVLMLIHIVNLMMLCIRRPARNIPINVVLIISQASQLWVVLGVIASLDCNASPDSVAARRFSEASVILALIFHIVAVVVALGSKIKEKKMLREALGDGEEVVKKKLKERLDEAESQEEAAAAEADAMEMKTPKPKYHIDEADLSALNVVPQESDEDNHRSLVIPDFDSDDGMMSRGGLHTSQAVMDLSPIEGGGGGLSPRSERGNPLPPSIKHYHVREQVVDDIAHDADRLNGRSTRRNNSARIRKIIQETNPNAAAALNSFQTFEVDVPSLSFEGSQDQQDVSGPSGMVPLIHPDAHSLFPEAEMWRQDHRDLGTTNPRLPLSERDVLRPLELRLPIESTGMSPSPEGSPMLVMPSSGRRRDILGVKKPNEACPSCGRYTGKPEICEQCSDGL